MKSNIAQAWAYSTKVRVAASAMAGIALGIGLTATPYKGIAILWGWDLAAAIYIVWVGCTIFRLDSKETARRASAEDPDRLTVDLLMFLASIASLAAVAVGLTKAGDAQGSEKMLYIVTCVASVFLSWSLVHCTFALKYARMYYNEPKGGIDFHSDTEPSYFDFTYLAFTVGMTFQVSDTDIHAREIRRAILRHAMLSYFFGTVIVATMVSLIAGLGK